MTAAACSVFLKFGRFDLGEYRVHPWIEALLFSHPSLGRRIELAREFARKRGITDDTRALFRLGYAPDTPALERAISSLTTVTNPQEEWDPVLHAAFLSMDQHSILLTGGFND